MPDGEKEVRSIKHYIAMGVGAAVGWGSNRMLIRLGTRITNAISGFKILETQHQALVGSGIAILVYLAILGMGWSKAGVGGDFLVGFSAGALLDEMLVLGA